jgi:fused signal recognition particle receptor
VAPPEPAEPVAAATAPRRRLAWPGNRCRQPSPPPEGRRCCHLPIQRRRAPERKGWLNRLSAGLRKTGASLPVVFTGTRIDDALYEELEDRAADGRHRHPGHPAPARRPEAPRQGDQATEPAAVKALLADAITDLLKPLQKAAGDRRPAKPTVMMVAGVNGAGKTTTIGKLTWHLAHAGATRAAGRGRHLPGRGARAAGVWADRNTVDIVSQEGGDPAAVSFDAVRPARRAARTW